MPPTVSKETQAMSSTASNAPLSDEEYETLDTLLGAPELEERAMDVSTLEGFLTAVAIGPNLIMPGQWLPWVWDVIDGEVGMNFANAADADRAIGLVMRHYNHMVTWLTEDPASFDPIFTCGPEWGVAEWCKGFLLGTQLDRDGWAPLLASEAAWFAPLTRLGTSEGEKLLDQDGDAEHWMDQVAPSVVKINAHWMLQRRKQHPRMGPDGSGRPVVRAIPKVGRNDPCHCGSGKKYKKCCADADAAAA
ncbi:uncharacterized protein AAKU55_003386 [Oxalobacteraceae bacterium GrIS 1.11]